MEQKDLTNSFFFLYKIGVKAQILYFIDKLENKIKNLSNNVGYDILTKTKGRRIIISSMSQPTVMHKQIRIRS